MHIGMLSPVAWRTPPVHYGPWELIASLLTEGLIAEGIEVTLFATANSLTKGKLEAVVQSGYEEDRAIDAKVSEYLHITNCFEKANRFDLIHNHFDFVPLAFTQYTSVPVLTTIHGFSSPAILPVYRKYNRFNHYVSISDSDRAAGVHYIRTIHHGIEIDQFSFHDHHNGYLAFFGRMHQDKGAHEAIQIARRSGMELVMAGIIQDETYFREYIKPQIDDTQVHYLGVVGPAQRNRVLGQAAALLHPINFREPFGLSVVEAMACGTPTIAFNKGSMPELISDGIDGFLVNTVDEAVAAVAQLPSIHRSRCRETAEERFSVQRMIRDYLDVYREILE